MSNVRLKGPRPSTPDAIVDKQYVDDGVNARALDNQTVHLTGNENITGKKTFTSTPPASTLGPSVSTDITNKGYVDSLPTMVLDDNGRGTFIPGGERVGSAQLNYLNNAFRPRSLTIMPSSVATLAITPDAPTMSNIEYVTWSTPNKFTYQGGMLTADTNAQISKNTIDGSVYHSSFDIEFNFYGTSVSLMMLFEAASDYQIFVDDQPVTRFPVQPPAAGVQFFTLTFAQVGHYRITFTTGRSKFIQALYDKNTSYMWAAPQRKKVAYVADSYGTGQDIDSTYTAIPHWVAYHTGFAIYRQCQGGTGYLNDGTGNIGGSGPGGVSAFGSTSRMNALAALPNDLDLLIVFGGGNDSDASYTQIYNGALNYYAAVKIQRPNLPIIVVGVESGQIPAAFSYTKLTNANNAIRDAALASTNVKAFIDMKSPEECITGTGDVANKNGTGNADFFISADRIHPNTAGQAYYGKRVAAELAKVVI